MAHQNKHFPYKELDEKEDLCSSNSNVEDFLNDKEKILKGILIEILGRDAISLGEMQVSREVRTLVKSLNYLILQMKFLMRYENKIDRETCIKKIYDGLIKILNNDKNTIINPDKDV